jgi:putative N6-adenine-specific DNA methylase
MELIATCAFGLEKIVRDELHRLGLTVTGTDEGRISFNGDELAMIRANLWLRCAERIQIKMAEFTAVTFDELFDNVFAIGWEKYIGPKDAFPNTATSVKSVLHSEPAIQSIVKKAMVKRLQQKHGSEVLPEDSGISYHIFIKSHKDKFTVSINTSGDSLHKRGYRTQANLAPIKETLAAAMVKLSDWTPARTLIDPFCGSGTIAIEAALIANNIAPGLNRAFAFQKWPWVSRDKFSFALEQARKSVRSAQNLRIHCYDIDPSALDIGKQNAIRAGISSIGFSKSDFRDLDFGRLKDCTIITNPPYGERLEEKADAEKIYKDLGLKFARAKGCSLFLITSRENFPALFGRPADKNRKLFNGNLRCYLYSYNAK